MKKLTYVIAIALCAIFLASCKKKNNFQVDVSPVKIFVDEEGQKRIQYTYSVDNISNKDFKNINATIELESEMADYIASGVTSYPNIELDIVSKIKNLMKMKDMV